jgi:hypothetical protein
MSKPAPLSRTKNVCSPFSCTSPISMRGAGTFPVNFRALPIRLSSSVRTSAGSAIACIPEAIATSTLRPGSCAASRNESW